MAIPLAIRRELQSIFASFAASHSRTSVPLAAGKAFEVWLTMKLAEHTRNLPAWSVSLRDGRDAPLRAGARYLLRKQRGGILPASRNSPSFVRISRLRGSAVFELHGSLQWQGRSNAFHEIDVSMIPFGVAGHFRGTVGGYPSGLPVMAFECKDKVSLGPLDEVREKLARMFDLTFLGQASPPNGYRVFADAAGTHVGWGGRSSQYRAHFSNGVFGIARAKGFQSGTKPLAEHYHVRLYGDLYKSGGGLLFKLLGDFEDCLGRL
ncbi:hypothetical protein [Microvirga sp. TS319]|uniref:hypothetical protein n=1 Tax=Microvirga sp. TS319 TaxID=3241165 RepID=UPI00351A6CB1